MFYIKHDYSVKQILHLLITVVYMYYMQNKLNDKHVHVLDEPNHLVEYVDHILNIYYQNVFSEKKKNKINKFIIDKNSFTCNNLVDIKFEDLLKNMFVVYQVLFDK